MSGEPLDRYSDFVKRVTGSGLVWLLMDGGEIAMAEDPGEGVRYVGLWPDESSADGERERAWVRYEAQAMPLDELLSGLLPALAADGVFVGVWPIWDRGVWTMTADDLRSELLAALAGT